MNGMSILFSGELSGIPCWILGGLVEHEGVMSLC